MAQSMMKKCVASAACVMLHVTKRSSSRNLLTSMSYSTIKKEERKLPSEDEVKKSVFISQSNDIYTNLALEDWLYRNFDFTNHHVLMVWRNDPCIVIGKHQNPWQETNVSLLAEREIALARRNSGGGTVYHDNGNLNLSFFSPRERYNRKYNLNLIVRALFREFSVNTEINERQDITVKNKYKVSGTAAKLGRLTAYHHCTLLVNSNKVDLSQALAKHDHGIKSNATASISSPIANLCETNARVTVDNLQSAVGWEYLRTPALHIEDGGQDLISKQRGFQFINPTEAWFPGITEIKNELQSWDWCFGRTPAFTVSRRFSVPRQLLEPTKLYSAPQELIINMKVEKGLINDVTLKIPPGLIESGYHGEASVVTHLKGKRFTSEALNAVQSALQNSKGEADSKIPQKLGAKEQFVAKCFDQVVNTV